MELLETHLRNATDENNFERNSTFFIQDDQGSQSFSDVTTKIVSMQESVEVQYQRNL